MLYVRYPPDRISEDTRVILLGSTETFRREHFVLSNQRPYTATSVKVSSFELIREKQD